MYKNEKMHVQSQQNYFFSFLNVQICDIQTPMINFLHNDDTCITSSLIRDICSLIPIDRQHMGTSAEEDNYNADVDGEGNQI